VNIRVRLVEGAMLDVVKYNSGRNDFSKKIIEKIDKLETEGVLLRFMGSTSNDFIIDYNYSERRNNNPSKEFIVVKPIASEINSLSNEKLFKVMRASSVTFSQKDNKEIYLWIDNELIKKSSADRNNSEALTLSLVYN